MNGKQVKRRSRKGEHETDYVPGPSTSKMETPSTINQRPRRAVKHKFIKSVNIEEPPKIEQTASPSILLPNQIHVLPDSVFAPTATITAPITILDLNVHQTTDNLDLNNSSYSDNTYSFTDVSVTDDVCKNKVLPRGKKKNENIAKQSNFCDVYDSSNSDIIFSPIEPTNIAKEQTECHVYNDSINTITIEEENSENENFCAIIDDEDDSQSKIIIEEEPVIEEVVIEEVVEDSQSYHYIYVDDNSNDTSIVEEKLVPEVFRSEIVSGPIHFNRFDDSDVILVSTTDNSAPNDYGVKHIQQVKIEDDADQFVNTETIDYKTDNILVSENIEFNSTNEIREMDGNLKSEPIDVEKSVQAVPRRRGRPPRAIKKTQPAVELENKCNIDDLEQINKNLNAVEINADGKELISNVMASLQEIEIGTDTINLESIETVSNCNVYGIARDRDSNSKLSNSFPHEHGAYNNLKLKQEEIECTTVNTSTETKNDYDNGISPFQCNQPFQASTNYSKHKKFNLRARIHHSEYTDENDTGIRLPDALMTVSNLQATFVQTASHDIIKTESIADSVIHNQIVTTTATENPTKNIVAINVNDSENLNQQSGIYTELLVLPHTSIESEIGQKVEPIYEMPHKTTQEENTMVAIDYVKMSELHLRINNQEDQQSPEKEMKYPTARGRGRPPKKVKMEEDSNSTDTRHHENSSLHFDNNLLPQPSNTATDISNYSAHRRTRRSAKTLCDTLDVDKNHIEEDDRVENRILPVSDLVEKESNVTNEQNLNEEIHAILQNSASEMDSDINNANNIKTEVDNCNQRSLYSCTEDTVPSAFSTQNIITDKLRDRHLPLNLDQCYQLPVEGNETQLSPTRHLTTCLEIQKHESQKEIENGSIPDQNCLQMSENSFANRNHFNPVQDGSVLNSTKIKEENVNIKAEETPYQGNTVCLNFLLWFLCT